MKSHNKIFNVSHTANGQNEHPQQQISLWLPGRVMANTFTQMLQLMPLQASVNLLRANQLKGSRNVFFLRYG